MSTGDPTQSGVAVITGAASGIGKGLAQYASKIGMSVVLADWDEGGVEAVASSLPGKVAVLRVDVREPSDLEELAHLAFDRFGHVDLLFNNAGVLSSGQSWEIESEVWQRSFDINVMGVVNGIRAFVPRLLKAGRPARIVNTASVGGFFSAPLIAPYSASKAAVVSLTEALAHELAAVGDGRVTTSVLAPGPVNTGIMREEAGAGSGRLIKKMRDLAAERGADPFAYAKLIFDAIDKGEFWIVPQPESLDERLSSRTQMILDRKSPVTVRKGSKEW